MLKQAKLFLAALFLCALASIAHGDNYTNLHWSIDRTVTPNEVAVNSADGTQRFNIFKLTAAGQPTPYFASTFCSANTWITASSGVPSCSQPAFSNLSGNISTGQMNGGAGASISTFWRGDGTWATSTSALSTGAQASQLRITLTSGVPVITSSVASATTVYCTPYTGSSVLLWNGSTFVSTGVSEMSQATTDATKSPAAVAASQVYDVFVWNDAGTTRCTRGPTWASGTGGSNTVRGTGAGGTSLTRVNGVLVNAAAITNGPAAGYGTYIGTIASDGSGKINMYFGGSAVGGSAAILGVCNYYNRVLVRAQVIDSTTSWTYATATYRPANNSTGNRINFVTCMDEDEISVKYFNEVATAAVATSFCRIGHIIDATASATYVALIYANAAAPYSLAPHVDGYYPPQLGSHFVQAVEFSSGYTCSFNGGAIYMVLEAVLRI